MYLSSHRKLQRFLRHYKTQEFPLARSLCNNGKSLGKTCRLFCVLHTRMNYRNRKPIEWLCTVMLVHRDDFPMNKNLGPTTTVAPPDHRELVVMLFNLLTMVFFSTFPSPPSPPQSPAAKLLLLRFFSFFMLKWLISSRFFLLDFSIFEFN